ncbi:peptidase S28 [Gloeophyllum trabeum ATCC 11539]|uniref:Peptidase S28 n=1 Tax=Gloeophyllum trabeum (strain ATCC 11539 / FP-39264 / Madison 617) TaxID=670483 RepID=S7S0F6_GLOTA|nr:peptidase S28 [Gloeophyllum trabeum ATCC 11539]EPQ59204.1 peptidase S28 [Gloeophyllum trabeum ATCC 11539]
MAGRGLLRYGLPFVLTSLVAALTRDGRPNGNLPPIPAAPAMDAPSDTAVTSRNGTVIPPYNTTYYFEQLIDHNNPSLGTFQQRYWHTWENYEEGGPIILMTPGEVNAAGYTGYLTNRTINGRIAQQQNGATIVLEHRFYGLSNPYPDLSSQSFRVHTIEQAVQDLVYFAKNVKLPMPGGDAVTPDQAPWILIGGSYSGALTGWTMVDQPDVFYAGYASSAVVEAILDYWGYFEPIRQYMPRNCSADVEAVIAHMDQVFTSGTPSQIAALKAQFGMSNVTHLDDVAGALRNNLWDWQSLSPDTGPGAQFFQFCDALEVKNGVSAPATGWGLEHALQAWGSYFANVYYPILCGDADAEDCLGTYDQSQSYWTDTSIDNAGRSWEWIVCTEVGFLQDGAPPNWPTLVTRLVQPAYDERQCSYMFPEAFPTWPVPNVTATNAKYHGWNLQVDRLFFANGQRDPWREATVSADGVYVPSTPTQPIAVGDGYHCSDLIVANAEVDATVMNVQNEALGYMKTWLSQWKKP